MNKSTFIKLVKIAKQPYIKPLVTKGPRLLNSSINQKVVTNSDIANNLLSKIYHNLLVEGPAKKPIDKVALTLYKNLRALIKKYKLRGN